MEVQPDFKELLALFNAHKRAAGRTRDLADLEALGEE
jgi:hypothetical protein